MFGIQKFPSTHRVHFVHISEITANISIHNIKQLVFANDMKCVYCVVWAESFNKIQVKFNLKKVYML